MHAALSRLGMLRKASAEAEPDPLDPYDAVPETPTGHGNGPRRGDRPRPRGVGATYPHVRCLGLPCNSPATGSPQRSVSLRISPGSALAAQGRPRLRPRYPGRPAAGPIAGRIAAGSCGTHVCAFEAIFWGWGVVDFQNRTFDAGLQTIRLSSTSRSRSARSYNTFLTLRLPSRS